LPDSDLGDKIITISLLGLEKVGRFCGLTLPFLFSMASSSKSQKIPKK
tara:strand:- start:414 stop:557 length:144 start_codon:yes stop_codon:yes gene_type:complete